MQRGNIVSIVLVFALSLVGCGSSSGSKDAADYCLDMCDTLLECPNCQGEGGVNGVDPDDLIADNIDTCIDLLKYQAVEISIRSFNDLESTCIRTCREVNGTINAISSGCRDAHEDVWRCNGRGTCDQIEQLGFLIGTGGVFLPNLGDCAEEVAIAVEECADEVPN